MVGKSVLLECVKCEAVTHILLVSRKSVEMDHPKIKEVLHKDFLNLEPIQSDLVGYDAIFHCMGVSAVGMKEATYTRLTYDLTVHWAETLFQLNPHMVFNYVSGEGTDSREKARAMWARVKGRTENMVLKRGFKDAYMFRPGGILVEKGIKASNGSVSRMYAAMRPLLILLRNTRFVTTGPNIGQAMINSVLSPQDLKILTNRDIDQLAAL